MSVVLSHCSSGNGGSKLLLVCGAGSASSQLYVTDRHINTPAILLAVHKAFGISLPTELITTIDKLRGDVTRSRYIQRLIEKALTI